MKSPIMIVILLINFVAIGFTAFMYFKKDAPKEVLKAEQTQNSTEGSSPAPKIPEEIYYPLETFTVNLNETGGQRILKISMEFIVNGVEVRDELERSKAQYRDLIINILSSKKYDELDSKDGKELLKEEILNTLNPFLKKGLINKVVFTDMIYN